MTRIRPALVGLLLVLLVFAGVGLYLYQNLPALLRLQARHLLQQYGVKDVDFAGLWMSSNAVHMDNLKLRGTYTNLEYEVLLTSVELRYNWRLLLEGKIQSLTLSSLELSIDQTKVGNKLAPATVNVDELLPYHHIAQLPLNSLHVSHWTLVYRSPGTTTISATGSLQIDEGHADLQLVTVLYGSPVTVALMAVSSAPSLDLDIALRDGQSDVATLSTRLRRATAQQWEWDLQGQWQHTPLLAWLQQLFSQTNPGLDIRVFKEMALQGQSSFTARVRHPDQLNLAATRGTRSAMLRQFEASIHLVNEVRQFNYPATIEGLNGVLEIDAAFANRRFEATLQPFELKGNLVTQQLSLPEKSQRWLRWEKTIPLQWSSAEPLKITSDKDDSWSLQLHNARLDLGDPGSRLSLQGLDLDATLIAAEAMQMNTRLSAELNARLRRTQLPGVKIAFSGQGNVEQSEFSLQLVDAAQSLSAGVQGKMNLATGSGEYQLSAQSEDLSGLAATAMPLLQAFELMQDSVELRSGSIHLNTALTSKDFGVASWQQRSQLALQGVSGSINGYRFDGLALAADWSGIMQWKTWQPVEFSLDNLNIGVDLHDIQARVSLPNATPVTSPLVRIETFSAGMFGGQLILPQAGSWDFSAKSNQVTLRARRWQLAKIVALQKNEDLQAKGVLEGELPVTITGGRVIIEKGYLRALPPGGSIRYAANDAGLALARDNPELKMALDLLSDFQYQVLSSEVELDNAGNLRLGLSLAGSNPAQYEGQPINFNINLEENLDPLLQSLRLSDKLVERIEGGLR